MTIANLYDALAESDHMDPTRGYSSSSYFVYAINDNKGTDDSKLSNMENLEAVGAEWYRQLHRPTTVNRPKPTTKLGLRWSVGDHKLFGGPLNDVDRYNDGTYSFSWFRSEDYYCFSLYDGGWNSFVSGDICVAVVHR